VVNVVEWLGILKQTVYIYLMTLTGNKLITISGGKLVNKRLIHDDNLNSEDLKRILKQEFNRWIEKIGLPKGQPVVISISDNVYCPD
jgi:hypothetical protein